MGIKTVDDIKIFCQFRRLFWKVCSTSATDDHNIDLILHILCIFHGVCFYARCFDSYCCRISSGKYTCQFHIFILTDRHLNAFSQIAITCNTDSIFSSLIPPVLSYLFPESFCTCFVKRDSDHTYFRLRTGGFRGSRSETALCVHHFTFAQS